MASVEAVGVDGCRAGWIAVFEDGRLLRYRLFERFSHLLDGLADAACVLVDIPIGLPWSGCPTRPCDAMARCILGHPRASSVFPAPSRDAARAASIGDARSRNLAELGRSLSSQAWAICVKVAEVDQLLLADARTRARVREVHPEVCFWALNGGQPMTHAKSRKEGRLERLRVLARHEPRSPALVEQVMAEQRRSAVQYDDVLDALAAWVTAARSSSQPMALRGEPARDSLGLPMEMLYA